MTRRRSEWADERPEWMVREEGPSLPARLPPEVYEQGPTAMFYGRNRSKTRRALLDQPGAKGTVRSESNPLKTEEDVEE